MRILIKGGVWKNTEDEILKAAVMKYGKNGWARVASLLNRKSAKQCKARWYEWLDPSIKKTEWSKDEEEKLLHLAKLMPNQWRTLAPIVGRTAAQCMEHYERLLDQAQEEVGESSEDARRLRPGEIDPAPETKPARPDPIDMDEDEKEMLQEARARLANTKGKKAKRKARERQLDDSRRLSMLQKRRELKAAGIESRMGGGGSKKRKYIDYAREIPFQKVPPAGYYNVGDENAEGKKQHLDPHLHGLELSKMEGRHAREEEDKQKQKDQRAMKKLFKENAPLAVSMVAAANDPVSLRRRVPLSLPTPQVTEGELEEIVKLNSSEVMSGASNNTALLMAPPTGLPSSFGNNSSQSLIADYSRQTNRALPTPMRTPLQEDIIRQEARNLRAMRQMTPLFGNPEDSSYDNSANEAAGLPEMYEGTGFEGVQPRRAHLPTPNTLLNNISASFGDSTPASTMSVAGGGGGSVTSRVGSSNIHSQLRDPFGLNTGSSNNNHIASTPLRLLGERGHHHSNTSSNATAMVAQQQQLQQPYDDDDSFSVRSQNDVVSVASSRFTNISALNNKYLREQVIGQLKSLPEPEFTYEVALPQQPLSGEDVEQESGDDTIKQGSASVVEDAAESIAKQQAMQRQLAALEASRRSTVIKRDLPRPTAYTNNNSIDIDTVLTELLQQPTLNTASGDYSADLIAAASAAINQEMAVLLQHDGYNYPLPSTSSMTIKGSSSGSSSKRKNATNGSTSMVPVHLAVLSDDYLQQARTAIVAESQAKIFSNKDSVQDQANYLEEFEEKWNSLHKDLLFIPSSSDNNTTDSSTAATIDNLGRFAVPQSSNELLGALMMQFAILRARFELYAKRATKLESKLQITTQGYMQRYGLLQQQMTEALESYERARMERECFATLRDQESKALQRRISQLHKEVAAAEQQEWSVQQEYSEIASFAREVAMVV